MIKFTRFLFFVLSFVMLQSCGNITIDDPAFLQALENGKAANEGFSRSLDFVKGWLNHADSITGLIPRNLDKNRDFWNAQDAAADNYPFMVLTSSILDEELFNGKMLDMLETETRLTSRVGKLPDTYSFSKQAFLDDEVEMGRILFGASEYMKDGLMPLTEWLGQSPWLERMKGMLDDFQKQGEVITSLEGYRTGYIPVSEMNGELLQVLSRMYWITGEQKYLDWATKIGDYYLLEGNLPSDMERLRLRDHGCEVIAGLSELYVTLHFVYPEKKEQYRNPMYKMLDRILKVGVNEHGLFYNRVNPVTAEVLDSTVADTWGYTFNAYYSVYLVDGKEEYRDAVLKGYKNIIHYVNFVWEGNRDNPPGSSDGYADAIESALNLYNREPDPLVENWIDNQIKIMFSIQKEDGIIEGWHGDGNFARTTIMYCLWKTQGTTINPWREDVVFGAAGKGDALYITLKSEKDWEGKLKFDISRHKEWLHLPIDYPRINQFPEWYTVSKEKRYKVRDVVSNKSITCSGEELQQGLYIELVSGKLQKIIVEIIDPI